MGAAQSKRKAKEIEIGTAYSTEPDSPTRQRTLSSSYPTSNCSRAVNPERQRASSYESSSSSSSASFPATSPSSPSFSKRRMTITRPYNNQELLNARAVAPISEDPQKIAAPHETDSYFQSTSLFLPKDWESGDRFLTIHIGLKKLLFADNAAPAVLSKLVPGACIVELGTANGPWIMDMATQYPECQFIGIDSPSEENAALHNNTLPLPNARFEIVDLATDSLPVPSNSVDVVHIRTLTSRLKIEGWPNVFREARRILKPNGIIQIVEAHFKPTGTVLVESFIETLRKVAAAEGQDYDFPLHLGQRLEIEGFQLVETKKATVHLGSDGKLGEEFLAIILRAFEALHPFYAPLMGIDDEDFYQRVEMVCSQCVQVDAPLDWYSYVYKKPASA